MCTQIMLENARLKLLTSDEGENRFEPQIHLIDWFGMGAISIYYTFLGNKDGKQIVII